MHVHFHQSTTKWVWEASLVQAHKYRPDRHTYMHVRAHTHTHTKNVTMILCFLQPSAIYNPSGWHRLHHCLPLNWGPALQKCHSAWNGWHDTWRRFHVGDSGIYIWMLPQIWREKQKSANGHLWQQEHKLTPSLTLTLHTQLYFSLPLFEIPHSFFFRVLTQSVCFAHCRDAGLFMCTFVLSTIVFVWFCLWLCQPSHSCQTIWRALVKQVEWVYWEVQKTAGVFDCPWKRLYCIMMLS